MKEAELGKEFEGYALQYLGMWLAEDKWSTETLNPNKNSSTQSKLEILRNAANYYRVARTMPKANEEKVSVPRLSFALELLNGISGVDVDSVGKVVHEFSAGLAKKYWEGAKRPRKVCISAASKFLWLKFQCPVVIFGSQALNALRGLGHKVPDVVDAESFEAYRREWHAAYEPYIDVVRIACQEIPSYEYLRGCDVSMRDLTSAQWFMERVFDLYLWTRGREE